MLRHRAQRKPRRPPGDNPLLRRRFEQEHELPPNELERTYNITALKAEVHLRYRAWLCANGIDPETGRMTKEGLAFFKDTLDRKERLVSAPPFSSSRPPGS